ncbi:ABC transporter permease, partial [bacterium]
LDVFDVVTTDVKHIKLAVTDRDNTAISREFTEKFVNSGRFEIVARPQSDREASSLIDSGGAQALLRLEHGFGADIAGFRPRHPAQAQFIVDGADSNTAGIVASYASLIAGDFAAERLKINLSRTGGQRPVPSVNLEPRAWFNDSLESINFFIPGVIAILVMLVTLMMTGMAIVREKEAGTMELLMVMPIRPVEFILGKTIPFAIIGFIDVLLVTGVGVYWFDVPVRGSISLLMGATSLYLMTTLGIGLFISTVSSTQQQAMMGTFLFFFPAMLLSGFIFPINNMPEIVQWLTLLNPLRYFLVVIRAIFLKGSGIEILWPELLALFAIGLSTLALALSRFKKTLG